MREWRLTPSILNVGIFHSPADLSLRKEHMLLTVQEREWAPVSAQTEQRKSVAFIKN
jgi:hypothetical protein